MMETFVLMELARQLTWCSEAGWWRTWNHGPFGTNTQ
jgi:hypothetical protein